MIWATRLLVILLSLLKEWKNNTTGMMVWKAFYTRTNNNNVRAKTTREIDKK